MFGVPGTSRGDLSEWLEPRAGQAPPTWPAAEIDPARVHMWNSVNGALVRTDSPLSACALRAGGF
jgi:hypothetical protein